MKVLIPFIRLFSRQWLMMSVGLLLTIITLMAGIGLLSLSGWFLSATAVAGLTIVTAQSLTFLLLRAACVSYQLPELPVVMASV